MTTLTLPPPTITPAPPPPAAPQLPPPGSQFGPPQAPDQARRPNRRALKVFVTLAVLGLAASVFMIASLALFTDTESVGGNTFTTGTLDLAAAPVSAVVSASAMAPGDQVTGPLDMTNSGTLALRYSATKVTTENVLAAELVLTVKSGVTTCNDASWTADGVIEYTGVLGTTTPSVLFGDATPGADTGDRTLAPAASEQLCVNVTLPITATGGQGITTTATIDFVAEQTANNP